LKPDWAPLPDPVLKKPKQSNTTVVAKAISSLISLTSSPHLHEGVNTLPHFSDEANRGRDSEVTYWRSHNWERWNHD
jgi:hypothetical protein